MWAGSWSPSVFSEPQNRWRKRTYNTWIFPPINQAMGVLNQETQAQLTHSTTQLYCTKTQPWTSTSFKRQKPNGLQQFTFVCYSLQQCLQLVILWHTTTTTTTTTLKSPGKPRKWKKKRKENLHVGVGFELEPVCKCFCLAKTPVQLCTVALTEIGQPAGVLLMCAVCLVNAHWSHWSRRLVGQSSTQLLFPHWQLQTNASATDVAPTPPNITQCRHNDHRHGQ